MANRPALVKQADLTRYVAGVKRAGIPVLGVKIAPDGTVTLITAETGPGNGPNPCDRLLDQ